MPRRKKQLGKGARVSVLFRYLHPAEYLQNKVQNARGDMRIDDFVVDRLEQRVISHKQQLAVVLHHANFKDDNEQFVDIFVCQRWCRITAEGDPDLFFNNNNEEADVDAAAPAADAGAPLAEEEQDGAIVDIVNQVEARGYVLADDVARLANMAFVSLKPF